MGVLAPPSPEPAGPSIITQWLLFARPAKVSPSILLTVAFIVVLPFLDTAVLGLPPKELGTRCANPQPPLGRRNSLMRRHVGDQGVVSGLASIARPVSLSGTPDRGDPVKATTVAAPLEFADKWKKPK